MIEEAQLICRQNEQAIQDSLRGELESFVVQKARDNEVLLKDQMKHEIQSQIHLA